MPRSTSGKWVARAAATGGGRTYRGQVPVNWYAALVLIVLVGLGSIVFARYEYEHGAAANTVQPVKGATWFAAIDFDICGTQQPPLASNVVSQSTQSFYTTGKGVIVVAPKTTSAAGTNAVLGKFVKAYHGLTLTSTELVLPSAASPTTSTTTKASKRTTSKTYRNGETCPKGTKDSGKKAHLAVTYWKNAFAPHPKAVVYTGDPATLPFTDDQLITVGFVPSGTTLPKPNGTIVTALLDDSTGAGRTTTTTAPASSSTTTPSSTSSTSSTTSTTPTSST